MTKRSGKFTTQQRGKKCANSWKNVKTKQWMRKTTQLYKKLQNILSENKDYNSIFFSATYLWGLSCIPNTLIWHYLRGQGKGAFFPEAWTTSYVFLLGIEPWSTIIPALSNNGENLTVRLQGMQLHNLLSKCAPWLTYNQVTTRLSGR